MAISPTALDVKLQEEANHCEKIIDALLVNSSLGAGRTVTVGIPVNMNHSHLEILRTRYIKVGWTNVLWHSDQREGDWLAFTA
jgi:hypothetical protein